MHARAFVAIGFLAVLAACSRPAPPPEPPRSVRTQVVGLGSAAVEREFAADIRARTESRLGFRVPGKLVRRLVDTGQAVKAGQTLAWLDPQDMRLGADAARAAVVAAQANHEQAAADFRRFKELREQGFISSAELERRETALKAAQAQLDQARANASLMGHQAGYAALVADAAGVVTAVEAEPGAVLAAGTPVLRLAHDGPRDAVIAVPEDQVKLVEAMAAAPGALAFRPWGAKAEFPARLREVSASADPATRTFMVKLDLGQAPGVRLGQTGTAVLRQPAMAGVIKLPLAALKEEQGRSQVWVVDPQSSTVALVPVQLAGMDGNDAVIAGGLRPGQRVVTAGVHVLTPGQKVRLLEEAVASAAAASQPARAPQPRP